MYAYFGLQDIVPPIWYHSEQVSNDINQKHTPRWLLFDLCHAMPSRSIPSRTVHGGRV